MKMMALRPFVLVMLLLLAAPTADAAPITFSATGSATSISDPFGVLTGFGFATGQVFTVSATIDPVGLADVDASLSSGIYNDSSAASSISATLNGYAYAMTETQVRVTNQAVDAWEANSWGIASTTAPGLELSFIAFAFIDSTGTALSSDALVFPPLFSYDSSWFTLQLRRNINGTFRQAVIRGTPTPVSSVPEPASLLLLGIGVAGIAAKVRKRRLH